MEQLLSRHLVPGFPRRRIDLAAGETSLVSLGGEAVRVVREGARLEVGEAGGPADPLCAAGLLTAVNCSQARRST